MNPTTTEHKDMFTEYEIETMIDIPAIREANFELKKKFIKKEAPYLEISDHDFFSMVMMAPSIGIAKSDGKLSLFEELALNKKARKLSKGGYFMKKDPVIYAMKFLMKKFDAWEADFLALLRLCMHESFDMASLELSDFDPGEQIDYNLYKQEVLNTPYILIRFISSFFLESDEDIINENHRIREAEYQQLLRIGELLNLTKVRIFQLFVLTYKHN